MVLYIAGLQAVPKDLYEAARLMVRDHLAKLRYVTLPMINSTIVINVLNEHYGCFCGKLDIVYITTGRALTTAQK